MNRLTFAYDDDGTEGYGWTVVSLEFDAWSGRGSFWGTPAQLLTFADQLAVYPIRPEAPPEFRSYPEEDPNVVIRVEPADRTGHLDLRIVLTDSLETNNRLSACVATSYAAVQRLEQALRRIAVPPHRTERVDLG